ncbi:hypothetical protein [Magnetospirillum sp. UT-4]|uniref:hypothetical protein n=1 Tax=Magnetospirillum sp. UT-4 TaxID=2681467 RepID=UPI00137D1BB7|nr:hypothetical protein [Magnetospirillum sp. UT-4]CAA7626135.1 conserved hypothetical protein [Magnetospirillum sp. UT-4]
MTRQNDFYLDAYDRAWKARLDVMRDLIAGGAETAFEVVRRLKIFEIDHTMTMDCTFRPIEPPTGDSLLPTGMPMLRPEPVLGRLQMRPFYDDHVDFLLHVLTQHGVDAIVELGSGYGRNLIELYARGGPKDAVYYAGEISEGGRAAADMLFALTPGHQARSFCFDHKDPDLSCLRGAERVLLFSYHSIEQVAELPADYFARLAACAPQVTAIHMEPFGFQLDALDGEPSRLQRHLFAERDWNTNLTARLLEANAAGTIRLTTLAKEILGGEPNNATSLAVWTNIPT